MNTEIPSGQLSVKANDNSAIAIAELESGKKIDIITHLKKLLGDRKED